MQDASNDQQIDCDVYPVARMPNHRTKQDIRDDSYIGWPIWKVFASCSWNLKLQSYRSHDSPKRQNNDPIEQEAELAN